SVPVALPQSGGVYKSTDGMTWTQVLSGAMLSLAMDPNDRNVIYAGGVDGIYKTTDAGTSWSTTAFPSRYVWAIAVDPNNSSNVYAGTGYGRIYRSTTGGSSWVDTGFSRDYVTALAIDANSSGTVYASTTDGIFKTM